MKPREQLCRDGRFKLRLFVAVGAALIPLALLASGPAWWSSYGVLSGGSPDDYAVANQGQVKNLAVAAVSELDNDLAQFGGSQLDSLATALLTGTATANDYSVVNLGQLKSLTQPFYDRLLALPYYGAPLTTGTAMTSGTYPWIITGLAANDYAVANIGQVKNMFTFDVTYSSAGNGIPDWWVEKYYPGSTVGGVPGVNPNAADSAGDGLTNLQAFDQGTNPILGSVHDTGGVVNLVVFTPSE